MILAELIEEYISGDWGNEELSTDTPNQVYCVRAADFVPILSVDYTNIPIRYISDAAYNNKRLKEGDIVIEKSGGSPTQSTGRVIIVTKELLQNKPDLVCSNFCEAFRVKEDWNPFYVFSYLQFLYNQGVFFNFEGKTSGLKNLQMEQAFNSLDIPEQKSDISILNAIDKKIALNRNINKELEALTKQIYDYWFVQFDFPNEQGQPYKSSGGKMVWNEKLKRELPEGWEITTLSEKIANKKSGDWGQDIKKPLFSLKVNCVRGADFSDPTKAPTRYISKNNSNRLLDEDDIIVEISGGSPIQATGRSVFVTKGLLENFCRDLICSNFCQALTVSDPNIASYFYYTWLLLYSNGVMFNYEGKTSGIKNLQIDTLLENLWFFPPKILVDKFDAYVKKYMNLRDLKIKEINQMSEVRERLLPMLMNGQIVIKD